MVLPSPALPASLDSDTPEADSKGEERNPTPLLPEAKANDGTPPPQPLPPPCDQGLLDLPNDDDVDDDL